jgi:four helix bundle protein
VTTPDPKRTKIRSFQDLIVWQKSMDLAAEVYRLSSMLPRDERFRLVDQLNRAATSVPANIAEGFARSSSADYARFLAIAKGSLAETHTLLLLACRLGLVSHEAATTAFGLIDEISRMLTALRAKLIDRRS